MLVFLKKDNQISINKINKIFNSEKILKEAIERFIIKGNNSEYYIATIIYGEVNDFVWATRDDIKDIVFLKKDMYSTAVHFWPITCQPKNRCLNYNPKYEKDRFCVQLKWYNLYDDIIENMNNKVMKKCSLIGWLHFWMEEVYFNKLIMWELEYKKNELLLVRFISMER